MSVPTVSIVTVVRDDRDGLARTIESIRNQTWVDFDLIIKDGASRDGTCETARQAAANDARIHVLSSADAGIYDAMNVGLRAARGTYVIFMNAGDGFASALALETAIARLIANPQLDIGFFGAKVQLANGRSYLRTAKPVRYISYGQPALHQATIFRTDFHQRFPYSPDYPVCADYVCVAQQLKAGARAHSFTDILSQFEITQRSTSYRRQRDARAEFARAIEQAGNVAWPFKLLFRLRRFCAQTAIRAFMRLPNEDSAPAQPARSHPR